MTPEQLVQILATIKMLDPELASAYTAEQLKTYVEMAYSIVVASGVVIPEEKLILAIAIKTLSLLTIPENSSLSKKKIKDVEITYYQGQGKSKWDAMYDALMSGEQTDLSLNYVGI